ncbi:hypothetical protein VNO78_33506 [Psophocarpus tetragonolobus]|uniref:Uncharacterized protein n=1 Tax=Psophocarpus tetragonolobus TaxID=3891 RepID=A0AAN9NYF3_PSOTE
MEAFRIPQGSNGEQKEIKGAVVSIWHVAQLQQLEEMRRMNSVGDEADEDIDVEVQLQKRSTSMKWHMDEPSYI